MSISIPSSKICIHCHQEKSPDDFYYPYKNVCKQCNLAYQKRERQRIKLQQQSFPPPDVNQTKQCRACKEIKNVEAFKKDKGTRGGYISLCKACHVKEEYKRSTTNPNRTPSRRWKKINFTYKEYCRMLEEQGGVCAICKQSETIVNRAHNTPLQLAVDHNHDTGQVRSLLCSACNLAVERVERDIEYHKSLLAYLELHS